MTRSLLILGRAASKSAVRAIRVAGALAEASQKQASLGSQITDESALEGEITTLRQPWQTRRMGQAGATGVVAMAAGQTGRDHRGPDHGASCGVPVALAVSRQSVLSCPSPEPQPNGLICRVAARSSK